MKIRVYVQIKNGYPTARADEMDVDFICSLRENLTTEAKEKADELLYKIEKSALDYVTNWSLEVPTTVLVDLDAVGVDAKE